MNETTKRGPNYDLVSTAQKTGGGTRREPHGQVGAPFTISTPPWLSLIPCHSGAEVEVIGMVSKNNQDS